VNLWPRATQSRLYLIFDVFNALNSRTPTAVTTSDIARFGQVSARRAPLRVQAALNWIY
jgi:hypothetical protein